MKKPILFGILGLFIGTILYLVIMFLSPTPVSESVGGWIALATGVIFFFWGRGYYSKKNAK
jgi:hypothetical protein